MHSHVIQRHASKIFYARFQSVGQTGMDECCGALNDGRSRDGFRGRQMPTFLQTLDCLKPALRSVFVNYLRHWPELVPQRRFVCLGRSLPHFRGRPHLHLLVLDRDRQSRGRSEHAAQLLSLGKHVGAALDAGPQYLLGGHSGTFGE
jgi:hypothetical protein